MASPEERVCRALCRHEGHPENITLEGAAMWQSYKGAAGAVLTALALEPLLAIVREVADTSHRPAMQARARDALAQYKGNVRSTQR